MSFELPRRVVVLVAVVALPLAACDLFDTGTDVGDSDMGEPVDPGKPDEPEGDDPCICMDDSCVQEWMRDNGYCDTCAVFSCERGETHACISCSGGDPGGAEAKRPRADLAGDLGGRPGDGLDDPPAP